MSAGSPRPMRIAVDVESLLAPAAGREGIPRDRFERALREAAPIAEGLARGAGRPGFARVPEDEAALRAVRDAALRVKEASPVTFLHIGIGGSALGTRALDRALANPGGAPSGPRLVVLDNPDPETVLPALDALDLERTFVHAVSKSGTTPETVAIFSIVLERLRARFSGPEAAARIAVTTGAGTPLDRFARSIGAASLPIPEDVGGRWSVLTPVGLFPAAVLGYDVDALLEGARSAAEACAGPPGSNPALRSAVLLHLHDVEGGRRIHVHFVYSDALRETGAWYAQLGAESLGKARRLDGSAAGTGPTPVVAVGATDQHSQLQLYSEGPDDKVFVFWEPVSRRLDATIPAAPGLAEFAGALPGRSLGQLLSAELAGTRQALLEAGRPAATIRLPAVDAASLAEAMTVLMFQTVFLGALYGVDPFDQPGVEASKRLTAERMRRTHPSTAP